MWSKYLPLFGGLCLAADFDQMWSRIFPLVGGLCHAADFDQMWSKYLPLFGGLCLVADFDQMWSRILPHVEDLSRSGLRLNVVHKMPTIDRVFKNEKPAKEKGIQRTDSDQGCQQALKIESDCVNKPKPNKNDANAFVTPRRKNDAVASTKITPKDTGMCIDVIKRSYMIYLVCLKIFCMRTLVFWSRFLRIPATATSSLRAPRELPDSITRASRRC
jgi:hypothetical protein